MAARMMLTVMLLTTATKTLTLVKLSVMTTQSVMALTRCVTLLMIIASSAVVTVVLLMDAAKVRI